MNKQAKKVVQGAALTAVVGTTVGLVAANMNKGKKKSMKKRTDRAVKSIGNFIDNVSYMMK